MTALWNSYVRCVTSCSRYGLASKQHHLLRNWRQKLQTPVHFMAATLDTQSGQLHMPTCWDREYISEQMYYALTFLSSVRLI